MCLYPRLILNRKYKANAKNGGIIPAIPDMRVRYVPVGCQVCIECKKQKARQWQVRLSEEIKNNRNGRFITLTFSTAGLREVYESDDKLKDLSGYDLDNGICTRAVRLFLERWRKKYKVSLRHWFITELGHGETEHVHLHGIVWTDDLYEIERIWKYGFVWKGKLVRNTLVNYVNEKTVNYIIKYVTKIDEEHLNFFGKVLCSPGIGKDFINSGNDYRNRFKGSETDEGYRLPSGRKVNMPIYYRNKLYSEKEKEMLWLDRLDKNIRFVCGCKVDMNSEEGVKAYYNMVDYYRRKSIDLGYPSPDFIYSNKAYEELRRKLIHEKRLFDKPPTP